MRKFLENAFLKVEIDTFGAEIKSVMSKADNREYMWYGNPKFWGRTSPVLFPFVGSLKDKKYTWKGREYPMGQHGFARDNEFALVEQTENAIWFSFSSNDETMKVYPFAFRLMVGYTLEQDTVRVTWKVENPADETMYFSIGAHPAFLCPVHRTKTADGTSLQGSKTGYKLYFEGADEIHHHGNDAVTGMSLNEDLVLPLQNHRATITEDFFDRCTYMVEGSQTRCVGLEDEAGNPIVRVMFDTPLFAIWSPEKKNAPFLCIEPWYGRCDAADFTGDISMRKYTNELPAGEVFTGGYAMQFFPVGD